MEHSAKMMILMKMLAKCEAIGDKLLVFSQSISTLDLIEKHLNSIKWVRDVDYFRLDGQTPAKVRQKNCTAFNNAENTQARYVQG